MKKEISQYCGMKQHTDREVIANRTDIIIKNKKGRHAQ
jgi:hypothetical protein